MLKGWTQDWFYKSFRTEVTSLFFCVLRLDIIFLKQDFGFIKSLTDHLLKSFSQGRSAFSKYRYKSYLNPGIDPGVSTEQTSNTLFFSFETSYRTLEASGCAVRKSLKILARFVC